ncbi:MAG: Hsp20 family protein [Desulfatiglans sp.]|jgi:HSP20 family protein|nr:Hsp20 family protein [Desulfatiglans sp.]
MPVLTVWKNQEIGRLKKDIDRIFARLIDDCEMRIFPELGKGLFPRDLFETDRDLVFQAKIPGLDLQSVDISISEDSLHIKGEINPEITEQGGLNRRARGIRKGFFSRVLRLPCRVNIKDVKATYKNDVLHIVMPKTRPSRTKIVRIRIE